MTIRSRPHKRVPPWFPHSLSWYALCLIALPQKLNIGGYTAGDLLIGWPPNSDGVTGSNTSCHMVFEAGSPAPFDHRRGITRFEMIVVAAVVLHCALFE